jgi:hypothetical protein
MNDATASAMSAMYMRFFRNLMETPPEDQMTALLQYFEWLPFLSFTKSGRMLGELPFPPPDFMERVLTAAFRVPTLRTVKFEINAFVRYEPPVPSISRAAAADAAADAAANDAAFAAGEAESAADAVDEWEWDPRLRALSRTLPLAEHLNELTIEIFGADGILTGELIGQLKEGFVHTSISILNITFNEIPLEVDSFYVARLRHQMAKVVDPPTALLPHMMRQTGLDLRGRDWRGEVRYAPSMPRQMSILNATFLTLQRHTAQLAAHWEEEAHEE